MADTLTQTRGSTELAVPWNVIVHDDPVNLMGYVTLVLMKILGYPSSGPVNGRRRSSTPSSSRPIN